MGNKLKHYRLSFFIIITVVLSAYLSVYAEDDRSGKEVKTDADKHFLWAVEGKRNTVYLMGSMHVLTQNAYPLPPALEDIYACCSKLIFEVNINEADSSESQSRHMALGIYKQGKSLSGSISEDTFSALKLRFEAVDLHVSQFERFKPWFVAQLIGGLELMRLGHNPNFTLEKYFLTRAIKDKKDVAFLESVDYTLNNMAKLKDQDQEMFLKGILKELDIINMSADDMIDAWKKGNTDKLTSIHEKSFQEYPHLYDLFITSRNEKWVLKMKNLLKHKDNILIIINARHLVGKEGVIDLLLHNGYKLKQM